jgi:hypothetical protein
VRIIATPLLKENMQTFFEAFKPVKNDVRMFFRLLEDRGILDDRFKGGSRFAKLALIDRREILLA